MRVPLRLRPSCKYRSVYTLKPSVKHSVLELVLHHTLEKNRLAIRGLPVVASNKDTVRT